MIRKLTDQEVDAIRQKAKRGNTEALAQEYSIHYNTIGRIIRGETYKLPAPNTDSYVSLEGVIRDYNISPSLARLLLKDLENVRHKAGHKTWYYPREEFEFVLHLYQYVQEVGINFKDCAKLLDVTPQRFYQLIDDNKLPLQKALWGMYIVTDEELWQHWIHRKEYATRKSLAAQLRVSLYTFDLYYNQHLLPVECITHGRYIITDEVLWQTLVEGSNSAYQEEDV